MLRDFFIIYGRLNLRKNTLYEGHGFSRAVLGNDR